MTNFKSIVKSILMGTVQSVDPDGARFQILCRTGDRVDIEVTRETVFGTISNLDELDRDRIPRPAGFNPVDPRQLVKTFVRLDRLVVIEGIYQQKETKTRFCGRFVHIA